MQKLWEDTNTMTRIGGFFDGLSETGKRFFVKGFINFFIEYLKKGSTIDKICYFVIDNDPSIELYNYLELRKQSNEISQEMYNMLVYKWPDLIEYLNTEEGREKLLRMLRNINKWINEVSLAEQQHLQQQQQQQQQPDISEIKGRPAKVNEDKETEHKEPEKKSEEKEPSA